MFPPGNQRFVIIEVTRDISNICVSTFGIYPNFWFVFYRWVVKQKLYPSIFYIIFNNIITKFLALFVRFKNSWCILLQINIHWWRINMKLYLLPHITFKHCNWHIKMSKRWKNFPISNVSFPLEKHCAMIK